MSTPTTTPLDGEDLINYDDVTARIAYLESRDCHQPDRETYVRRRVRLPDMR